MREEPRPSWWKSPWPWIGLSCGVLVVGVVGVFVAVNFLMYKGYQRAKERIVADPVMVAERIALKDPNVKVVSRDLKLHKVTLSNQKTGERFLLEQAGKDKLRIQTDAGEVVPDFSRPQAPWLLGLGSAAGPMPAWVPVPPDTKPRPLYALATGEVVSGCSILFPAGPVEDVLAFYRAELERKGFTLVPGDSLSASSPDYSSSVFLTPTEQKGRSGLLLTWSEMSGTPTTGNPVAGNPRTGNP